MDMMADPTTFGDEPEGGEAMPDYELISILGGHESTAIGYDDSHGEITTAQKQALDYYNGDMDDVPAQEGCSSVVDGTVALVVDNALAAVLKPFVSSDETVIFSPRSAEDVEAAEQATEYVNYIINCDNPGFLIFHDWFKDAFLSKVGIVKAWWEDTSHPDTEQVQIEDEMHAAYIRQHPEYMGEENGLAMIGKTVEDGRCKVVNIPPEEFRISPFARSVETAQYAAHVPSDVTRSDLITMGFDPEIVEDLPAYSETPEGSTLRDSRYEDEDVAGFVNSSNHKPNDRIALRDEYVRVDYDGDGIAEMRRIIRVGDVILFNEEWEDNPFATLCPIPMPHKVFGHSLADRAVQEQKIGTVLWRQMLDNLYKSNNPRPVLGDAAICTDGSTEDSLTDTAPGAEIRVRDLNQFRFDAVPFVADKTFPMLELLDKKTEENTGVSKSGQGLDTNALKKSGTMTATEMSLIAAGKNARTEMVARIFAETGVQRLFKIILKLVAEHQPKERVIRLRNKWVPMDPRGWPEMDVQINVGLGIGDKAEQLAQADAVLGTMETLAASPYASLVTPENVYAAVKRKYNAAGIKNVDEFITAPSEQQAQPEKPDPETMKAQAELQMQQAKIEGEQQMAAMKLDMQRQEAEAKHQLAREQAQFEAELSAAKAEQEAQLAQQKMLMEERLAEQRMAMEQRMAEHKASLAERTADAAISKNRPGGDLDK